MHTKVKFIIFAFFLISNFKMLSAYEDTLKEFTIGLKKHMDKITQTDIVPKKLEYNDSLTNFLLKYLTDKSSFNISFSSINNIGIIVSPDSLFRIFNWYVQLMPDIYLYSAIVQKYNPVIDSVYTYVLNDKSDEIANPEQYSGNDTSWFGALYYDIIIKKINNNTFYTILGFDYNSLISRKKIIEVMYFKGDSIYFGYPIFKSKNKVANRVLFEYSSKVVMTLKYDINTGYIVFDHLSPSKPVFEGHYQYYGPDFSYDAFKFENNYWNYLPCIDIRNPQKIK